MTKIRNIIKRQSLRSFLLKSAINVSYHLHYYVIFNNFEHQNIYSVNKKKYRTFHAKKYYAQNITKSA